MRGKKVQAALEFLMAYGWAILVVLIAVGALAYFGVLDVDKFLPEKCTLIPGFTCLDFKATNDDVTLVIKNSLSDSIAIESITLTEYNNCETVFFTKLKNGEQGIFIVDCNLTSAGNKISSEIRFIYEGIDTLRHNASGKIISKIEKSGIDTGTGQTDIQICQLAQNDGTCFGLDLLHGEGYQAACCSEHSLCC